MSAIDIETKPVAGACFHFDPRGVRKICKMCSKPKEDHPFTEEDALEVKTLLRLFNDKPETMQSDEYAWLPPGCPSYRVDEYFQKFPDDQVPRHQSEAQNIRLKRLAFQIPPSDIAVCMKRFTEPPFKQEMKDYIWKLQTDVLKLGLVKEWSKAMPSLCPKCLLVLQPGELVISNGERGGQAYHPLCFVCKECKETPADLVHCFDFKSTVLCVRHYGNEHKKRCHTCDELIFSPEWSHVEDRFYHSNPNHLLCFACDEPLEGIRGLKKNGELYCATCYSENFAHVCKKCEKKILLDEKFIPHEEFFYHNNCFNCDRCNAPLPDTPFKEVDGEILCLPCSAPMCDYCRSSISELKVFKYEGKIYHVDCFRCASCKNSIGTGQFVHNQDDGQIYCKECYQLNFGLFCSRCNERITDDRGVMYDDQPYHVDCFTCYKCSKNIKSIPFKTVEDQWLCNECFEEKFCKDCYSCGEPITLEDVMYSNQDHQWHEKCFICSECRNPLTSGLFVIQGKLMKCCICINEKQKDASIEKLKKDSENEIKKDAENEERKRDAENEEDEERKRRQKKPYGQQRRRSSRRE